MTPLQAAISIALLASVNVYALHLRAKSLRKARRAKVIPLYRYRVGRRG